MSDRPRFSLTLILRDSQGLDRHRALDLALDDEIIGVSARFLQEVRLGVSGASFGDVVEVIKRKEIRKRLFIAAASQLAAQMAERMEDAEGWHDPDRVEPARKQLGGRWES